jgi:hypothetical protein
MTLSYHAIDEDEGPAVEAVAHERAKVFQYKCEKTVKHLKFLRGRTK